MSVNGSTNWETNLVHELLCDEDDMLEMFSEIADGDIDNFVEQLKDWLAEHIGMENPNDVGIVQQMKIAFYQSVDYNDLAQSHMIVIESEEE